MSTPRPIKHGTIGGYQAHKRRGEDACESCLKAWRLYYQKRDGKLPRKIAMRKKVEARLHAEAKIRWRKQEFANRRAKRAAARAAREADERSSKEER